jgi:hypothetical protein
MFRIAKVKKEATAHKESYECTHKEKRRFTTVKPFDFKHIGSCLVILQVMQKKKKVLPA